MSQPRGHCCSFLLLSSLDSPGEDCRHPLSQLPPIKSRYIPIVSKSWNRHRCPSLLSNCHFLFFIADRFLSNCHIPFNCLHTFLHCNCQFANIRKRFCQRGTTRRGTPPRPPSAGNGTPSLSSSESGSGIPLCLSFACILLSCLTGCLAVATAFRFRFAPSRFSLFRLPGSVN